MKMLSIIPPTMRIQSTLACRLAVVDPLSFAGIPTLSIEMGSSEGALLSFPRRFQRKKKEVLSATLGGGGGWTNTCKLDVDRRQPQKPLSFQPLAGKPTGKQARRTKIKAT